jgi:DNA-binding transcriptional LysR family regulator
MLSDDLFNTYDLIANGFDVAIRLSPVEESNVISRRIGQLRWILCSSPDYLARSVACLED